MWRGCGTWSWRDFAGALLTTVNPGEKPELDCLEHLSASIPILLSWGLQRQPGLGLRGWSQGELCPLIPVYTARYSRQPARRPSAPATCCEHKRNKTNLRGLWFPGSLGGVPVLLRVQGSPRTHVSWGLTFYIETLKNGHALAEQRLIAYINIFAWKWEWKFNHWKVVVFAWWVFKDICFKINIQFWSSFKFTEKLSGKYRIPTSL